MDEFREKYLHCENETYRKNTRVNFYHQSNQTASQSSSMQ